MIQFELDSCPNNPNAIISDPVDPDPVDESFTCYGCVNGHISPFQNAQNVGYLNSPDENVLLMKFDSIFGKSD